ncbi:hypothetical protein ABL78_6747 [Leptomonas seymouri]|uniref:Plant heme peroxidase family profile domain-containing protein n=1 Tax=Leptomonas seymouri TaxID=5684 RepID=A0A0N0P3Y9_LEPSE|nr:hypothetical protein ABL78_6747 [Leptomonas seymouri]|eukprot:KPI84207.1 hypothetical protein ABL78_6747 [Leptomonas seymouri]
MLCSSWWMCRSRLAVAAAPLPALRVASSSPLLIARRLASRSSAPAAAAGSASNNAANRHAATRARHNMFTAPPNVGPGRKETFVANPFKSWEHINHKWLLLMCAGCLCAGWLAGHFVEVDESKIKPKFSREDVVEAACKQFEFRPDLAATSIRVAFVLAARRAGFSAVTVDESCAVVRGLNDVAGVMNYLSNTFHASTEDIASLAAIAGIKYLNGPYEGVLAEWRWGRNDTDAAPARNVAKDPAQKTFSIVTILHSLGGLTEAECVALLACHSVGEFHEDVSGVDGATHVGKRYTLGNRYYQFLLEHEKEFKPLKVDRLQDNKELKELPQTLVCTYTNEKVNGKTKKRRCVFNTAEVELLKNKTYRDLIARYAADEEAWKVQFQSAFTKMIESNFKRLRVYSDPNSS